MTLLCYIMVSSFKFSSGAGRLSHRPVDLDLQMGPSAIPNEIPVNTGYLLPLPKKEVMFSVWSICLSVCLSVRRITRKLVNGF